MADDGGTPGSRPLPLAIALRYLRSSRRDSFVSFLSLAAACGIGLGVTALILALAALSGFQGALRDEILARTPEIAITPPADIDPVELAGRIASVADVQRAQALMIGRGWMLRDGAARPIEITAFDGRPPNLFPGLEQGEQGLYVGRAVAEEWRLETGDVVEIVSARPTLTPFGPQPRIRRIEIAGIFETGRTEYTDRVALPWTEGRSLIGSGGARILVSTGNLGRVDGVVEAIAPLLPAGAGVETWRELNRALLFALRLEKSLMFLGIFLIVVVASLALVSSLMLILANKRREIGMLRAMGARPATIRTVFLWLAAVLAGGGAFVGLGLGGALAWALDRWRLLQLPEQVYFLDYVPFRLSFGDAAVVFATSVALAGACSWWAASRAADLQPIEALRR